jgi:ankyrin repeat protein
MRKEEAHIRTAMYMAKLRAEKRAKQEVFNAMCRSQWSTGQVMRSMEEKEERITKERVREEKESAKRANIAMLAEQRQIKLQTMTSPWDVIKHHCPIEILHAKLTEEHRRWAYQEKKVFDVNSRAVDTGESLVGNAVMHNHEEALQYLIDMGANVNQIDSLVIQSTPLIQAARRGNRWVGIARILVQNGATMSSTDIRGDNALHIAAREGSERMVRFLLSCRNGRRSNEQRKFYPPDPLTESPERPEGESVNDYGQDFCRMIACPNNRSQTPLDIARNTGTFEAIQLFNEICSEIADMDDDDEKYLFVRKKRALKKEQDRLAEDLNVFGGGGLTLAPLLGPMSSRPSSGDLPDSVKLRNRLELAKKKHKIRRLKNLPGRS